MKRGLSSGLLLRRSYSLKLASIIVHEAWHYRDGPSEAEAYAKQIAFLTTHGGSDRLISGCGGRAPTSSLPNGPSIGGGGERLAIMFTTLRVGGPREMTINPNDRTLAALKAAETKGPAERNRAADWAAWTKRHGKDDAKNPASMRHQST